jgi:Ca2+-binding EF-hand superfamily protein
VNSRAGQVRDQLEGKSKGQAAGGSMFGGLFGRGGAPRPRSAQDSLRDMIARSGVLKLKKDTQIDRAAFVSVARKLFAKIDKDQSGSLSRREVAAMLVSQRGQNASPSEARRIQREYDKDKNRKLSAPEWDGAYGAAFATWDADDDGKLTREELNGR